MSGVIVEELPCDEAGATCVDTPEEPAPVSSSEARDAVAADSDAGCDASTEAVAAASAPDGELQAAVVAEEDRVGASAPDGVPSSDVGAVDEEVEELDIRGEGGSKLEEALTPAKDSIAALHCKTEGNQHFKAGRPEEALACYERALELAPDDDSFARQRSKFAEARDECDDAVDEDATYYKALFRRGKAHRALEEFDAALHDMQEAQKLEPDSPVLKREIAELEAAIKERNEKLKDEMLGKLKDLGNTVLGKFGMSLDNFQMVKDPATGSYSINFNQGGAAGKK